MAKGDNQGRMLFDLRGKRRNVVKVVYAVLALLMGLSLILLANPFGFGGGGGGGDAAEAYEEQTERIESRLAKEPANADLLLNLTRAQINTAYALSETSQTGEVALTVEGRQELQKASATWDEYLEATEEPRSSGAILASQALFQLAQTSRGTLEARNNVTAAAEAQRIVAEQQPNLGTLSNLSFYELYAGEFKTAEETLAEAKKFTTSKFERRQLENQYNEIEKTAREFQQQVKEAEKASKEGAQERATNPESFENPLGIGGGGLSE
jgi:DNA replication protein DnaD